MQCPYCGNDVAPGVANCPSCGANVPNNIPQQAAPAFAFQQPPPSPQQFAGQAPAKSKTAYVLLGVFLGSLGIHNFYAGYSGKGVAQLLITILTCGYAGIVSWIWAIIEICSVNQDSRGVPFV